MNALLRLADVGVKLPLKVSPDDVGVILDADGFDVITIDVNATRSDDQANAIATLIAELINASHWMRPDLPGTLVYVPTNAGFPKGFSADQLREAERERRRIAEELLKRKAPEIRREMARLLEQGASRR
ncbi:hypothetical protein [Neorhizobium petrolearium]|uniref:hypothetical protein n=1 Tax=Neorhizobium petrolearium TaxID=515361 RepID=UPI003F80FE72